MDPRSLALKDLNLLKKYTNDQDASSTLRVVFALSKWPHFHRAYLVTVCKRKLVAVFPFETFETFQRENLGASIMTDLRLVSDYLPYPHHYRAQTLFKNVLSLKITTENDKRLFKV